jgi:hypothetical protein
MESYLFVRPRKVDNGAQLDIRPDSFMWMPSPGIKISQPSGSAIWILAGNRELQKIRALDMVAVRMPTVRQKTVCGNL